MRAVALATLRVYTHTELRGLSSNPAEFTATLSEVVADIAWAHVKI